MARRKSLVGCAAASILACVIGTGAIAFAQSQKQLDLAAARAERKATVSSNMNLTADESKAFWPVYDEYESRMDKIEDRHVAELKEFAAKYNNLTEADAAKKLNEVMDIAEARLATQKEFIPKFRGAIPQVKVTRFFQIDNKIHSLIQCSIAQLVPLARSPGEASAQ
jgi:hypothetical protein